MRLARVFDIVEPGAAALAAVKVLRADDDVTDTDRGDFKREMRMMLTLLNPNVVRLHGIVSLSMPMMIVLEYMSEGSLEDFLDKTPYSSEKRLEFLAEVS